jgi:hypothetical protein
MFFHVPGLRTLKSKNELTHPGVVHRSSRHSNPEVHPAKRQFATGRTVAQLQVQASMGTSFMSKPLRWLRINPQILAAMF